MEGSMRDDEPAIGGVRENIKLTREMSEWIAGVSWIA